MQTGGVSHHAMQTPTLGSPVVSYRQPDREYPQENFFSQSEAKELLISPAHWMARYGPDAKPFFATPAMQLGTAAHHRVLEPDTFESRFVARSNSSGEPTVPELKVLLTDQGIEFKKTAKKSELLELAFPDGPPKDSRTILSDDDWEHVHGMHAALRSHDYTGMWFDPGQKNYRENNEVSVYAKTHQGHLIKGRFDRLQITGDTLQIVDLKTCDKATPKHFQRKVVDFRYDLQAAWYSRLAAEAFAKLNVEFIFVAIEKKPPYGICVYRASEGLIDNGNRLMDKALNILGERRALNDFPAYPPEILDLDLPAWETMQEVETCVEF